MDIRRGRFEPPVGVSLWSPVIDGRRSPNHNNNRDYSEFIQKERIKSNTNRTR